MRQKNNNKLPNNIWQLQNLIKRDPGSYCDEFYMQHQHFKSLLEIFKLKPEDYNKSLDETTMFMAQVTPFYADEAKEFPIELMTVLRNYHTILNPDMRMSFFRALILLRNKGQLEPAELITLCFEMLRCKDKILRKQLQTYIITDVKNINAKHKNVKLNSLLQNFMFKMLSESNAIAVKMSLDIMIELYKKNVWNDTKTVNAIATACFSKFNKVLVAAHKFFLGHEDGEKDSDSSESEDDTPTLKEVKAANKVNKKSRKRMKILEKTKKNHKRGKKSKKEVFDFSAIHLLHDPQSMAEKLMKRLEVMNERYEVKMMVMNFISRLIGVHNLIMFNFYVLLQRYILPHQRDVTKILMFAAQAAHEHVPSDIMEPVLRSIAYNFITERNSPEVITVGINSIREICIRCPLAISKDLLLDLTQYKTYKNKNVTMAARSLIQLFRKINPSMLKKRDRSKPTEASQSMKPLEYGASNAKSYIPGAEALQVEPVEGETIDAEESDDDSDGSWENMSQDADGVPDVSNCDEIIDVDEQEAEEKSEQDSELVEKSEKSGDLEKGVDGNNTIDNPVATAENNGELNIIAEDSFAIDKKSATNNELKVPQNDMEKAITISHSRILSQKEFELMRAAQAAKEVTYSSKRRAREANEEEFGFQRGEIVSLRDIERLHKKTKQDKESRLETMGEGREGREKFGKKKGKDPACGSSNFEKRKTKNFMMVKHKLRRKQKRSFRDKQLALKNSLLRGNRKKY